MGFLVLFVSTSSNKFTDMLWMMYRFQICFAMCFANVSKWFSCHIFENYTVKPLNYFHSFHWGTGS